MKHIAITIGPIYKTLVKAKKTRELWGASYLFSYLMEQFLEPFRSNDFIVPYIQDDGLFDPYEKRSVGVFHDRAIFIAKEGDKEKLDRHIQTVLTKLAENSPLSEAFVKSYFQINVIEVDVPEGANVIETVTPYLDTAELFYRVGQYDENELIRFLRGDNRYIKNRAFSSSRQKKGFPSLPEIALHDLLDSTDILDYLDNRLDEEESVYETDVYREKIKPYHKYVAIVNADGDRMGKVVETMRTKKDYQKLSKALLGYALEADQIVADYGGQTIYAGGDDLLFFAPVVSDTPNNRKKNRVTIFELCEELSKLFDQKMAPFNAKLPEDKKASISFGVGVTYYKFPLYEALERSYDLLHKAKSDENERNKIAYEVIKHSGQVFGAVVPKNDKLLYEKFLEITHYEEKKDFENFLHSLHYKLYQHRGTISRIATKENGDDRMQHFFDNYFDEGIHKSFESIFSELSILIPLAYLAYGLPKEENDDKNGSKDPALDFVYAALRFKKFLIGDKS